MKTYETVLAGKIKKTFWWMLSPAMLLLAVEYLLYSQGIRVKPVSEQNLWGTLLLVLSVSAGIALPIFLRALFQTRASRKKKATFGDLLYFERNLTVVTLLSSYCVLIASQILVPGVHLYGTVLSALYGVYSTIPLKQKFTAELRYYGIKGDEELS